LLNDNLGKSFALFINEYRIEEAKHLLKENNSFTLEAIGFEAGFSSKSTFYATFKKVTGQTPSEFKKQHS
jgi:AraC-like DNA-binding protein